MPEFVLLPMAALTFPDIRPEIITIGPFAIHWYGLGYVVGILFGWWYGRRLLDNPRLWPGGNAPFAAHQLDDFIVWAAVGIVGGGRLGYVLFYEPARYLAAPLDIIAIWQGGMSFHGGLIGMILAMILFARSRAIAVWSLFDVVSAGVPVGLGLVRCANFINSELWGKITNVPWAFEFPTGGPFTRHPSQLYEALLEGLVLFLVLRFCTHRLGRLGTPRFVAGAFLAGYGASRIFVEFFREPDAHIGYLAGGWLTMGMVLSSPMVLAGILLTLTARPVSCAAAR